MQNGGTHEGGPLIDFIAQLHLHFNAQVTLPIEELGKLLRKVEERVRRETLEELTVSIHPPGKQHPRHLHGTVSVDLKDLARHMPLEKTLAKLKPAERKRALQAFTPEPAPVPTDAQQRALNILAEHRAGKPQAQIASELGLSRGRISSLCLRAKSIEIRLGIAPAPEPEHELTEIDEMNLSTRAGNCLRNNNITTLDELCALTEMDLLWWPNFGRRSLNEIKEVLAEKGLTLTPYSKRLTSTWLKDHSEPPVASAPSSSPSAAQLSASRASQE